MAKVAVAMLVRCERDGTTWHAVPKHYTYLEKYAKQDGYRYPVRVINCPTCGRGYFQEADGVWRADRDLVVLLEGVHIQLGGSDDTTGQSEPSSL